MNRSAQDGDVLMDKFEEWLADKPEIVRDLGRTHPPGSKWAMIGQSDSFYYTPDAYAEDGTLTVIKWGLDDRPVLRVFGVSPSELTPWVRKRRGDMVDLMLAELQRVQIRAVHEHRLTGCKLPLDVDQQSGALVCGCGARIPC